MPTLPRLTDRRYAYLCNTSVRQLSLAELNQLYRSNRPGADFYATICNELCRRGYGSHGDVNKTRLQNAIGNDPQAFSRPKHTIYRSVKVLADEIISEVFGDEPADWASDTVAIMIQEFMDHRGLTP